MSKKNSTTQYIPSTFWERFKAQVEERAIIYFFLALSTLGGGVLYIATLPTQLDGKVDKETFAEYQQQAAVKAERQAGADELQNYKLDLLLQDRGIPVPREVPKE